MQAEFSIEETEVFAKKLGAACDSLFIFADNGGIPKWAIESDDFPRSSQ